MRSASATSPAWRASRALLSTKWVGSATTHPWHPPLRREQVLQQGRERVQVLLRPTLGAQPATEAGAVDRSARPGQQRGQLGRAEGPLGVLQIGGGERGGPGPPPRRRRGARAARGP